MSRQYMLILSITSICGFSQTRIDNTVIHHFGPGFKSLEEQARKTKNPSDIYWYYWAAQQQVFSLDECEGHFPEKYFRPMNGKTIKESFGEVWKVYKNEIDQGKYLYWWAPNKFVANPSSEDLTKYPHAALDYYSNLWSSGLTRGLRNNEKRKMELKNEMGQCISIIEKCAERGDRYAMYYLACVASTTPGFNRGEYWLLKLKENPDWFYFQASLVRSIGSMDKTAEKIREAAEADNPQALLYIAQLHYYGNKVGWGTPLFEKDLGKAWYWMRRYRSAIGAPSVEEDPPIDCLSPKQGSWKRYP